MNLKEFVKKWDERIEQTASVASYRIDTHGADWWDGRITGWEDVIEELEKVVKWEPSEVGAEE